MEPIGIGIIGTGVGRRHAQGLIEDPRVEKVILCSKDEEGLGRIAVCEAIYESYRTGKPVQVEEV